MVSIPTVLIKYCRNCLPLNHPQPSRVYSYLLWEGFSPKCQIVRSNPSRPDLDPSNRRSPGYHSNRAPWSSRSGSIQPFAITRSHWMQHLGKGMGSAPRLAISCNWSCSASLDGFPSEATPTSRWMVYFMEHTPKICHGYFMVNTPFHDLGLPSITEETSR